MLCVLPVHFQDSRLLFDLLGWIKTLGGCPAHDALLVSDNAVQYSDALVLLNEAKKSFNNVSIVTLEKPVRGWPQGPKAMWEFAARHIKINAQRPWLWLEPDCVPLKPNWLDAIELEYSKCGAPFMFCQMETNQPGFPNPYPSAIAVYPADAIDTIWPYLPSDRSWEIAAAPQIMEKGKHTDLIQNLWGEPNLPPTFVEHKTPASPRNAFSLDYLKPQAALFHRNKDGTLIRLLRQKMYPQWRFAEPINVVFNVCPEDINLAMRHAQWLNKLAAGTKWKHPALVTYDRSTDSGLVTTLTNQLRLSFEKVGQYRYQTPPQLGWPHAPNWAWQRVAEHMSTGKAPWFFFEADAVVLKAEWLAKLQAEYERAQKSYMGPLVPGMRHLNGSSIYSADAAFRLPKAMAAKERAWDYECADDMGEDKHDSSRLTQHLWAIVNDEPHPNSGPAPRAVTLEQARRWLLPSAVVVHRIKCSSVVDLLISGKLKP